MLHAIFLSCCLFAVVTQSAFAKRQTLKGPVEAEVLKVRDGDTLLVRAHIWPGQHVEVFVRIRGIDAPELKGRCTDEKRMAKAARDELSALVMGARVRLSVISGGKYYGRVLAKVSTASVDDVEAAMLASGLVRPYRGRKRQSWCKPSAALFYQEP